MYRIVLRAMCTLLGFVVVQEHSKKRDSQACILVANYTSTLDRLVVELAFPCIMVLRLCELLSLLINNLVFVAVIKFCTDYVKFYFLRKILVENQVSVTSCLWSQSEF